MDNEAFLQQTMAILHFSGPSCRRKPVNLLALTATMIQRLHLSTFSALDFLGVRGKFMRNPSKCPNVEIFQQTYSEIQALDDGM